MCPTVGVSVGPIEDPSSVWGAVTPGGMAPSRVRVVEACVRSCDGADRFERRGALDSFDAPPGSVPYHRYIEAQNRADRQERPEAPSPSEPERRPEAARIGDVSPVPEQASAPTPEQTRPTIYHEYREAMTGRLIDVVY